MATKSNSKGTAVALAEQLIAGTNKHLANTTQVLLTGGSFTPAQVTAQLQAFVNLRQDVDSAVGRSPRRGADGVCDRDHSGRRHRRERLEAAGPGWMNPAQVELGSGAVTVGLPCLCPPFPASCPCRVAIVPFLLPTHRTGRDYFSHPALGRLSHQAFTRPSLGRALRETTPSSPKTYSRPCEVHVLASVVDFTPKPPRKPRKEKRRASR